MEGENNSTSAFCTKLFVTGVPSKMKPENVIQFFKKFGPVSLYGESQHGTHDIAQMRGYCIMYCYDESTAVWITRKRYFQFLGRTLSVTVHKSGIDLFIQNKRINKSRVIFKKVPKYFSESQFLQELEERVGAVQSLFQFKPMNPYLAHKKASNQKLSSYSVVFEKKESAKKLIEKGCFILSNETSVIAERYIKHYKAPASQDLMNKPTRAELKLGSSSCMYQGLPQDQQNCFEDSSYEQSPMFGLNNHHLKPTAKAYYSRKGFKEASIMKHCDQRFDNIRFNVTHRPLIRDQ